ncbi:hypothetical protein ACJX0J_025421 [Zea mays]
MDDLVHFLGRVGTLSSFLPACDRNKEIRDMNDRFGQASMIRIVRTEEVLEAKTFFVNGFLKVKNSLCGFTVMIEDNLTCDVLSKNWMTNFIEFKHSDYFFKKKVHTKAWLA